MASSDERLASIERAVLAIGEYVAFEGRRGSHHDDLRHALRRALDDLRASVGSGATSVPSAAGRGQHATEAPGAELTESPSTAGDATDPVPPNLPTTYLPGASLDAQERRAS
jgi:hypothetical protein